MTASTSTYAGVGTAYMLSNPEELEDGDKYTIHGVAIGAGDITIGKSGTKKLWTADALEEAAETLEGQELVRDHINNTEGTIGTVTHAEFVDDVGVIYEAEIASHYEELAQDVQAGIMEVSIRAYHPPEEELEEDEETGALIIDETVFDNLSVVNDGAAPSNSADGGPVDNMLDDPSTAAASAVVGDNMATATLERSVEDDQETVENAFDAVDPHMSHDKRTIDTEYAYVEIDHQSGDGESITVAAAEAEIPFYVCTHAHGYEYVYNTSEMSGSLGEVGPFDAGEEVSDLEIELDDPLTESQTVFATLHYANADGEKGSHILAKDGFIQDAAMLVVDSDDGEAEMSDINSNGVHERHTESDAEEDMEELSPDGIFTADGTWFAVAPDEHSDDSTEHAEDAKYPLTSCTGENSVEAAWNLRGHGDHDIDQDTLESRIQRAAENMDCDLSLGEEENAAEGPDAEIDGEDTVAEQSDHDEDENTDNSEESDAVESEELATYELHEPQWEETIEDGWSEPTLGDWDLDDWDEMNDIQQEVVSEHFLLSGDGFPPESFEDLALPVVTGDGELSLEALESVEGELEDLDVGDELADDVEEWVEETINAEFEAEEAGATDSTVATNKTSSDASESMTDSVSQLASLSTINATMIDYEPADTEELSDELDEPVVVEREELESMADKAEKADDVESELEQLSDKLDEQSDAQEIVGELSDAQIEMIEGDSEISVVEAGKADMVDQVSSIYAEELAEYSPWDADELADRFDPLELKDKVDEHEDAELSSAISESEPEPDAGSASDEELSGEEQEREEELEDARERYAEQLESAGWGTQAEKVRNGEISITDE